SCGHQVSAKDHNHISRDRRYNVLAVSDHEDRDIGPEGGNGLHPMEEILDALAHQRHSPPLDRAPSIRRTVHTAKAATPSPWPMGPNASLVVAFTDTLPTSTRRHSAITARI